jgi:hypothetical protein
MQAMSTNLSQLQSLKAWGAGKGWLRVTKDSFPHLRDVSVTGSGEELSPGVWNALRVLPALKSLRVGPRLRTKGLAQLATLHQLEELTVLSPLTARSTLGVYYLEHGSDHGGSDIDDLYYGWEDEDGGTDLYYGYEYDGDGTTSSADSSLGSDSDGDNNARREYPAGFAALAALTNLKSLTILGRLYLEHMERGHEHPECNQIQGEVSPCLAEKCFALDSCTWLHQPHHLSSFKKFAIQVPKVHTLHLDNRTVVCQGSRSQLKFGQCGRIDCFGLPAGRSGTLGHEEPAGTSVAALALRPHHGSSVTAHSP